MSYVRSIYVLCLRGREKFQIAFHLCCFIFLTLICVECHTRFLGIIQDALSGLTQFLANKKCFLFHLKSTSLSQDI